MHRLLKVAQRIAYKEERAVAGDVVEAALDAPIGGGREKDGAHRTLQQALAQQRRPTLDNVFHCTNGLNLLWTACPPKPHLVGTAQAEYWVCTNYTLESE